MSANPSAASVSCAAPLPRNASESISSDLPLQLGSANAGSMVQRVSLPELAAQSLRDGIASGRWTSGVLPSEAELCRELRIGRETLRRAMRLLVAEKLLIMGGRGKRHRIVSIPERVVSAVPGRVIRILTPVPLKQLGETHLAICETLRECAERGGYRVEMECHPRVYQLRDPSELARLHALPDTAGWVVFFSTEAIQRVLMDRGIPAVLVGPAYAGIQLPTVWPDSVAAARHAVGLFHARGHRRVAYAQGPKSELTLGIKRASVAFSEEAARLGITACTLTFDPAERSWRSDSAPLLAMRHRPTAILCSGSYLALNLLCHAQNGGLRVPRDLSLVSLWPESFMRQTEPALANYLVDSADVGRKIARLLFRRIVRGPAEHGGISVIPEFEAGGSLGPPPSAG